MEPGRRQHLPGFLPWAGPGKGVWALQAPTLPVPLAAPRGCSTPIARDKAGGSTRQAVLAALPGEEEGGGLCSHPYQQSLGSSGSPRHWGHEFRGGGDSPAGWTDASGQGDRSWQRGRHQALKGGRQRQEHPVQGQPGRAVTWPPQHPPTSGWQLLQPSVPGCLHPPQIPRASRNPAGSHGSASLREKYKCI